MPRIRTRDGAPVTVPGRTSTPTNGVQCILTQVAAGTCVQDSVTRFNLFKDPQTTPLGTGQRQQYGVQVSGGSDVTRYYLSGEWEDEVGQTVMPTFAQDSLMALRQISEVPNEQLRPNGLRRVSIRANIAASPNSRMDLEGSTAFITSTLRVLPTDNNTTGLLSNALGGPGNVTNGRYGYRLFTPNEMFSESINQDINRFIGGILRTRRNMARKVQYLTLILPAAMPIPISAVTARKQAQSATFLTSLSGRVDSVSHAKYSS